MLQMLGADVVGMSTVPEAIVARHAGLEVLAFAAVANWGAGMLDEPLSHEEVLAAMNAVGPKLADVIARVLPRVVPA
jgi:purine-nucleoside phosphorylase